jgi:predicted phage terminase large subunit-like protein
MARENLALESIKTELARREFYYFVQLMWPLVVSTELVWGKHMRLICDELQKVGRRAFKNEPKEYDLIINVPPGSSKTTICTILFPVWCWLHRPDWVCITASYAATLSIENGRKAREVMLTKEFRRWFGHLVAINNNQMAKRMFNTKSGGSRINTSVGGALTGSHADLIILDDIINAEQSFSPIERETARRWLTQTVPSRKTNMEITPSILVMQRLHEEDATGVWLSMKGKVKQIALPAELGRDEKNEFADIYTDVDGVRYLDPVRLGPDVLRTQRETLGTYSYAGQYLQKPVPLAGGIIKKDWFAEIDTYPAQIVWHASVDPAYTADEKNDPTGILVWAKVGNLLYISHAEAVHMEFPELIKYIQAMPQNFNLNSKSKIFVEPKASGKSLVQTLRKETALNIVEDVNVDKSKQARVQAVAPMIESRRVCLPAFATWKAAFVDECTIFPNGKHDDMLDCLVMALNRAFKQVETIRAFR